MKPLVRGQSVFLGLVLPMLLPVAAYADADADCRSQIAARVVPGCTERLKTANLTVAQKVLALQYRSWANTDLKAFDLAEADVNEIFKLEPNSAIGYGARGRLRHFLGNNDLALNDYNQSVALAQNKYVFLLNRGLFFVRTMNFDPARVDYEAAMALDPKKAAPYLGRARVHRQKNNDELALSDYDKAIALEPELGNSYLDRGELLLALKQPKRALADFDHALNLLKTSVRATRGRESALGMLSTDGTGGGSATPASAPASTPPAQPARPPTTAAPTTPPPATTAANNPQPPPASQLPATQPQAAQVEAMLKEALELRRAGKHRDAVAIYDKILAADPEQYTAMLGRAAAFEETDAYPPAYQGYEKLRKSKASAQMRLLATEGMMRVAAKFGDYRMAVTEANEALKLEPKSQEALFWRGFSLIRLQRYSAAIADLRQTSDAPGGRGLAWEAFALVANGDYDNGVARADAALKVNDKLAAAYVARARVMLAKGDVASAEAENTRALQVARIPEATYTQQLITLNRLMKPTDGPLSVKRN